MEQKAHAPSQLIGDMAQAIGAAIWPGEHGTQAQWRRVERAAVAALLSIEACGFRVVPVTPTPKMREATRDHANQSYIEDGYWAWEIMLNVAPKVVTP